MERILGRIGMAAAVILSSCSGQEAVTAQDVEECFREAEGAFQAYSLSAADLFDLQTSQAAHLELLERRATPSVVEQVKEDIYDSYDGLPIPVPEISDTESREIPDIYANCTGNLSRIEDDTTTIKERIIDIEGEIQHIEKNTPRPSTIG